MKPLSPLWLTAIMMFFLIADSNALTSQVFQESSFNSTEDQNSFVASDLLNLASQNPSLFFETSTTLVDYSLFTMEKLNYLYLVCIGLVLINLIVQIKIIYQMIHLFFLFRKKTKWDV